MIIDNKDKIAQWLKFSSDTYYFVQVIRRRRENSELDKSEVQLASWFIDSMGKLDKAWDHITLLCTHYNARCYVSLIPRSKEKLAKSALVKLAETIKLDTYDTTYKIFSRLSLSDEVSESSVGEKYWILDIDSESYIPGVIKFLDETGMIIRDTFQTPRGLHILVSRFNLRTIEKYKIPGTTDDYKLLGGEEFTVIKQCNTILYASIP